MKTDTALVERLKESDDESEALLWNEHEMLICKCPAGDVNDFSGCKTIYEIHPRSISDLTRTETAFNCLFFVCYNVNEISYLMSVEVLILRNHHICINVV